MVQLAMFLLPGGFVHVWRGTISLVPSCFFEFFQLFGPWSQKSKNQQLTGIICEWPPHSNSHHQEYYMF